MTTDGANAPGSATLTVRNPATGEVFAQAPDASATDLVPLTAVDDPPDDSRVVVDEAFGPVLGAKQSGFGQENGLAGLPEFTRPKSIFIPKVPAGATPEAVVAAP